MRNSRNKLVVQILPFIHFPEFPTQEKSIFISLRCFEYFQSHLDVYQTSLSDIESGHQSENLANVKAIKNQSTLIYGWLRLQWMSNFSHNFINSSFTAKATSYFSYFRALPYWCKLKLRKNENMILQFIELCCHMARWTSSFIF